MATTAQIAANRENAQLSTGPKSPEGKAAAARNGVTLGLFTMNDFVRPEETAEHETFCASFWGELHPSGPVEETLAHEIVRAAWRLRRCGLVEASLAANTADSEPDPMQSEANSKIQAAVDRARAQANNTFRRNHTELRRLQAARVPVNGFEFSNPAATLQPHPPAQPAEAAAANQTQFIPRSAPCPCNSGEKYKRCCGRNAPPLLRQAA